MREALRRGFGLISILALAGCATAPNAAPASSTGPKFPDAAAIRIMAPGDSLPVPARMTRGPAYPPGLRNAGVAGQLVVAFVIDSAGRAEPRSISFVEPGPHVDFQKSICEFLREARFITPRGNSGRQRILVFMPIEFTVTGAPPLGPLPDVTRHQTSAREMPREELVAYLESRPHCW